MTFLREPEPTPEAQAMYDADQASYDAVMNLSHLWAHRPAFFARWVEVVGDVGSDFSLRERGILVTATASTIGDSYCAVAWGWKLSNEADAELAAGVLSGTDEGLTEAERGMAAWARKVASSPGSTTEADVQALRDLGFDDARIFAMTAFVACRMAFSTINSSLGAQPDAWLAERTPEAVLDVVTWGRPVEVATVGGF